MGNRMLRESIRTSKTINAMSDFQFRVWAYLLTYVDDYGRGSADPELLKGFVFPRRKRISELDIEKTLAELAGMGCISLYEVDGESYFYFPNWSKYQRIQTKKSLFPEPTATHGDSRNSTVTHGDSLPEKETEEEIEIEKETEAECEISAADAVKRADYAQIVALYNEICVSYPRCSKLSDKRKKAISARISGGYTLDDFQTVFRKAEESHFLKGGNDRNWRADFDWMIADANMAKIFDGKYDDMPTGSGTNQKTGNVFAKLMMEGVPDEAE